MTYCCKTWMYVCRPTTL